MARMVTWYQVTSLTTAAVATRSFGGTEFIVIHGAPMGTQ